jgi:hypothetical protein
MPITHATHRRHRVKGLNTNGYPATSFHIQQSSHRTDDHR